MGQLLSIVESLVSEDTRRAVEYLRQEVAAGRGIGIAYVLIRRGPGRNYSIDFVGEAERDPTLARGAVGALVDQLANAMGSK